VGSIIVYSSYEKTQLAALAEVLPHLAPQLAAVVDRYQFTCFTSRKVQILHYKYGIGGGAAAFSAAARCCCGPVSVYLLY
jgi:hypothetical protein